VLDDRLEAVPLFVAAQATLAQPWVHIHVKKFDEVSRVRWNNCKIAIESLLPYLMIRSTG